MCKCYYIYKNYYFIIYWVNLHIQSKYRKWKTKKISVFRDFWRNVYKTIPLSQNLNNKFQKIWRFCVVYQFPSIKFSSNHIRCQPVANHSQKKGFHVRCLIKKGGLTNFKTAQKMNSSIKDFFDKCWKIRNLLTFTKAILNLKLTQNKKYQHNGMVCRGHVEAL